MGEGSMPGSENCLLRILVLQQKDVRSCNDHGIESTASLLAAAGSPEISVLH